MFCRKPLIVFTNSIVQYCVSTIKAGLLALLKAATNSESYLIIIICNIRVTNKMGLLVLKLGCTEI